MKSFLRISKDDGVSRKLELMSALYAGLEGAACGLRSNETPESRLIKGVRKTGGCLPGNRAVSVQKINLPVFQKNVIIYMEEIFINNIRAFVLRVLGGIYGGLQRCLLILFGGVFLFQ